MPSAGLNLLIVSCDTISVIDGGGQPNETRYSRCSGSDIHSGQTSAADSRPPRPPPSTPDWPRTRFMLTYWTCTFHKQVKFTSLVSAVASSICPSVLSTRTEVVEVSSDVFRCHPVQHDGAVKLSSSERATSSPPPQSSVTHSIYSGDAVLPITWFSFYSW